MEEYLDFEQPIYDCLDKIEELKKEVPSPTNLSDELNRLERKAENVTQKIYKDLSSWQKVLVARHPSRPHSIDYFKNVFDGFEEIHGDRSSEDDKAIIGGFAFLLFTLIDTPGAYPGVKAEYAGQHEAIAKSLEIMSDLRTPIINLVIGEGGSGGGFGIGLADTIAMLKYSIYSVASPEACSSILWRSSENAEKAAEALKLDAQNLHKLKLIDRILEEPSGGAHRNHSETYKVVKSFFLEELQRLSNISLETLLEKRYDKFIKIGL